MCDYNDAHGVKINIFTEYADLTLNLFAKLECFHNFYINENPQIPY